MVILRFNFSFYSSDENEIDEDDDDEDEDEVGLSYLTKNIDVSSNVTLHVSMLYLVCAFESSAVDLSV